MSTESKQRKVQLSEVKITKGEVDAALAAGNTHAKFKNRGIQKRLMKNQEKVRREQERRENHTRQLNKHREMLTQQNIARLAASKPKRAAEKEQIPAAAPNEEQPTNVGGRGNFSSMKIIEDGEEFPNVGNKITDCWGGMGVIVKIDEDAPVDEAAVLRSFGRDSEDSAFPLNLYGDENTYKPFPNIGDIVREDGLLLAIRKGPVTLLSEVNHANDDVLYAPAGTAVTEPQLELMKKFCADRKVNEPENFVSSTEPTDISSKVAAVTQAREERELASGDLETIAGLNPFEMAPDGPRKMMYHGYNGTPPDLNKIATESLPERVWVAGEKKDDDAAPDTTFALPA